MKPHDFRKLIKRLGDLNPAQVQDAEARITELRRRTEAITEIESRGRASGRCPHCQCSDREKWGRTSTNIQRYRCLGCRRTFTGRTGSEIQNLHRSDLFFLEVVKDMLGDRPPSSIRQLSRLLGLNKYTVWRWRMIILRALSGASSSAFAGIFEADETFQRESRKGSREWVRYQQNKGNHPKPPRRRWYEYGKKGIPMMRGLSRWQLPILTVADRSGARRFQLVSGRSNGTIHMALAPILAPDSVLCTDGMKAYAAFAQASSIEHFVIKPSRDRRPHLPLITSRTLTTFIRAMRPSSSHSGDQRQSISKGICSGSSPVSGRCRQAMSYALSKLTNTKCGHY